MIDPTVMQQAELRMWMSELDATIGRRPDWPKRRIAAQRVCEMTGLAEVVKAISANGELSIPPEWPTCDGVLVGGGVGLLTIAVRTVYHGQKREVRMGIKIEGRGVSHVPPFAEALERGRVELRKMIES